MCYIKYQLSFSCHFSNWRKIDVSLYRDPIEFHVFCRKIKIYDKSGKILPSIPSMHEGTLNKFVNEYARAWCKYNYGDVFE